MTPCSCVTCIFDLADGIPDHARAIVDLEDGTMAERTLTQVVLHGCNKFPDIGIAPDRLLEEARKKGKRPTSTGSVGHDDSPRHLVYKLRAWVLILQNQARVADAARVVHEALQEDEGLLEAVDAAYRLGGAKAVRDLLLRGASPITDKSC